MHRIMWVDVSGAPYMTGGVCTNRDETEVKRSSKLANLLESRAYGELVFWIVVIFSFWQLRDLSVSSVSGEWIS